MKKKFFLNIMKLSVSEENNVSEKKNKLYTYWLAIKDFFSNEVKKCCSFLFSFYKNENPQNKKISEEGKEYEQDYMDFEKYQNNYGNIKNYDNTNYIEIQSQVQMLASKQKLKQLESQTYSNRTMARLISIAELYALSVNCKNEQLYKKFDEFDNLNRKTVNELKGELILQIYCFKVSYESYVKQYKHYDFPDDYDEEKTLEELKNIEKNINEEDKKYYQSIIKLLNGDTNIPSFDEDLDELEEGENSDKKDPKLQLATDIPIMRYLDGIRKNLKKNYLEDPMNCKVKLNLDESFEKNEELQELVKKLDSKLKNKKDKNKSKLMHKCKSLDLIYKEEKNKNNDNNRHSRSNSVHIFSVKKNIFNYKETKDLENKSEYSECTSGNCSGDEIEDYK